jgi:hypothetical protein
MINIRVEQGIDEQGGPEEFTSEVDLLVGSRNVAHLEQNGLPRVGTLLKPGMIAVAKWGRSRAYDRSLIPTGVEEQYYTPQELVDKFGYLFINSSRYVNQGEEGRVVGARFEGKEPHLVAIVELNPCSTSNV